MSSTDCEQALAGDQTPEHPASPPPPGFGRYFRELCLYRGLLLMWSAREIKVRYKQSVLGAAWAVLQPLALMIVFSCVFSYFTRVPTEGVPYPLFSYTALLPWTFLANSVSFAAPSMINNVNLVCKVYFPREILPIGTVAAAFADFLVASSVFSLMLLYYGVRLTAFVFWLPLLVAIQMALTMGTVFFLSALSVKYRDIRFVVPLGLQIWMFASPVIYPASVVPARLQDIYLLNPMAALIEAYRAVIIHGRAPEWQPVALCAVISAVVLAAGYHYFKRSESSFADLI